MNDIVEFLKHKDWFTEAYSYKPTQRFWTFKAALNIFLQRGLMNIVETGTTRQADDWGAGMSTTIFGSFCRKYNKRLWTVDIDSKAIELCRTITKIYNAHIEYVVSDSVDFLLKYPEKIDLLYLDSLDCPEHDVSDSPRVVEAQEHQLKEVKAAQDKLVDNSIILLDDSGFESGGKTKLARKFLRDNEWMELINQQQSLWIRK